MLSFYSFVSELVPQHMGNQAFIELRSPEAKLICISCHSAKCEIRKHWVGKTSTKARRFLFLANHLTQKTMGFLNNFIFN